MNKATIEKVKTAMYGMQRRSWEQGTAMQGLMAVGDTIGGLLIFRLRLLYQGKRNGLMLKKNAGQKSQRRVSSRCGKI